MRPKQWVKNAFVFAGIVFAEKHLFTDPAAVARVMVAFVLFRTLSVSDADHSNGTFTAQLLSGKTALLVLGDKAYLNAELQTDLQERHDITLLTPRRANQREQLPAAVISLVNHFRQLIETINS